MNEELTPLELKQIKEGLKELTPEVVLAAFNVELRSASRYSVSGIRGAFALKHEVKTSQKGTEYMHYSITHFGDGFTYNISNGPLGLYYYIVNELGLQFNVDYKSEKFSTYNFQSATFGLNSARFKPFGADDFKESPFTFEEKKALLELRDLVLERDVYGKYQIKEELINSSLSISSTAKAEKKEFIPPSEDIQVTERAYQYLHNKRGIPQEVIERAKEQKDYIIYGYRAGRDERLIFLSERAGEWRSIKGDDKKSYAGSDGNSKKGTCYVIRADVNALDLVEVEDDDAVRLKVKPGTSCFAVCEAAIDALSYNAMFPDRAVMASNGSVKNVIIYKYAKTYRDYGHSIRLATDADSPGDSAAQVLYNAFYLEELFKSRGADASLISKMIYDDALFFDVKGHSEHLLFFGANIGSSLKPYYNEKYHVYDESGGLQERFNKEGKPLIRLYVTLPKSGDKNKTFKTLFAQLEKEGGCKITDNFSTSMSVDIYVDPKIHNILAQQVVRERPLGAKDWNEILKENLGPEYQLEYTKVAQAGFRSERGEIVLPSLGDNPNRIFRHYHHLDLEKEYRDIHKLGLQKTPIAEKEEVAAVETVENKVENTEVDIPAIKARLRERRSLFQRLNVRNNGENTLDTETIKVEKTTVAQNIIHPENAHLEEPEKRGSLLKRSRLSRFMSPEDLLSGEATRYNQVSSAEIQRQEQEKFQIVEGSSTTSSEKIETTEEVIPARVQDNMGSYNELEPPPMDYDIPPDLGEMEENYEPDFVEPRMSLLRRR